MMIDPLFTLYCEDCETTDAPSRLWVRAQIERSGADSESLSLSSASISASSGGGGSEIQHYIECMNCGYRFKSCMEDHMEAVDEEEWRRFVDETPGPRPEGSLP